MITLCRLAVLLLVTLGLSLSAQAQANDTGSDAPALLVADSIFVTADQKLVAEGNVEAFQGDIRLRAQRITFDRASGSLSIDGPIRIDQGDGTTVLASAAEMDEGLQNGLLSGARLVLAQQLQLASVQMTRLNGRYTQLDKTAVTSCHVCDDGEPPLWQIRARRVIHDQLEKQLYFEGAQFRIRDVPVFYFPRLRLPDPSLKRASGFLIPSIRTTSALDTGIRVPYFFRLGDHADLTISPYWSPRTNTLDFRYRQAFRNGRIAFEGAYTRDDLIPGESRGYLFGYGWFDLPQDFKLTFDIETVSDNAYLIDYGLPYTDRLESQITLTRTKRNSFFQVGLIHFDSLRDGEDESLVPTEVADAQFERRFFVNPIGGELRVAFDAHAHRRSSNIDVLGRDVRRATAELLYLRSWILKQGLRIDGRLGFAADIFDIEQDSNFPDQANRATPEAAVTLKYPMTRRTARATHFLEPIVQVAWTNVTGDPVPNDESRFVEFDTGNLLSLSRFPAPDRREDGLVAAYGINWARFGASGWQASASVGQVFREVADPNFSPTSGLSGTSSDYLVAGQIKMNDSLSLTARSILDEAFSFAKAELRGDWVGERTALTGTYLWLGPDDAEDRPRQQSEVWLDGSYKMSPNWTASANWRYDLSETRATTAGIGLVYTNECVEVDLSLNRRFITSTSVEPVTDFGFTIALRGFSVAGGSETYRRRCS